MTEPGDTIQSIHELFEEFDQGMDHATTVLETDDGEEVYVRVEWPKGKAVEAMKALAVAGSAKSLLGFLAAGLEKDEPSLIALAASRGLDRVKIIDAATEKFADGPLKLSDADDLNIQ